jgi:hypothetical protein
MNKLLLFPLMIMCTVVLLYMAFNGTTIVDTGEDIVLNDNGYFTTHLGSVAWYNNNTGSIYEIRTEDNKYIDPQVSTNDSFKFYNDDTGQWEHYANLADFTDTYGAVGQNAKSPDLFDANVLWGILALALGVGIAVGVTVFGTGISEFAQRLVFTLSLWGAIWLFLTSISYDLFNSSELAPVGALMYLGLTMSFIIGVGMTISDGGD